LKYELTQRAIEKAFRNALQKYPLTINVVDRPTSNIFYKQYSIGAKDTPPIGYEWEILAACCSHVNGFKSLFQVINFDTLAKYMYYDEIAAATASGYVQLDLSKAKRIVLRHNLNQVFVGGGVGASWVLLYQENKLY